MVSLFVTNLTLKGDQMEMIDFILLCFCLLASIFFAFLAILFIASTFASQTIIIMKIVYFMVGLMCALLTFAFAYIAKEAIT